jgi:hypothetical protein
MNRQTFFLSPKFNKKPIYNSPTNKYQEFTNAYVYSVMVKTSNHTPNHAAVCQEAINEWNNIKKKSVDDIDDAIWNYMATPLNLYDIQSMRYKRSVPTEKPNPPPFIHSVEPLPEIPANASAQRRAADEIQIAKKKFTNLNKFTILPVMLRFVMTCTKKHRIYEMKSNLTKIELAS